MSDCQCTQSVAFNTSTSQCTQWQCTELYGVKDPNAINVHENVDRSKIFNATYQCIPNPSYDPSTVCSQWTADKINLGTFQ